MKNTFELESGEGIELDVEAGEPGRPSKSDCKAYEERIIDRLRDAGCDGVQIYDDVCPDRQLANWHSRPGMSCDARDFMTFWVGDVDFYVTVPCTPASPHAGDAHVVPPMDGLEASFTNDADVEGAIPDGLVIRASYDLDAYHDGDREYIQSFDRLDELVDFIASDGFRDSVTQALGIPTLGEGLTESRAPDGGEGPDHGEPAGHAPELDLTGGEFAGNRYVHDENDPSDGKNMATGEEDAESLIRNHMGERVWVLSYSDGYNDDGELDGRDYGGRRVMTYDEAVLAWQNYPLEDELAAALDENGYEDEHYELHILLNYATDLNTCDSDDDRDWDWDSLIPVADRYVLYDPDED